MLFVKIYKKNIVFVKRKCYNICDFFDEGVKS